MSRLFALVSESSFVRGRDLHWLALAVERNAADCAALWHLEPPAVVVCEDGGKLPAGCHPVVFVDDKTDLGNLAEHYVDPKTLEPAARVYVHEATGLFTGDYSMSEGAAHEVLEALCDPYCNEWVDDPLRPGVQVAKEACDPTQTDYQLIISGTSIRVSNFVTPSWFNGGITDPQGFRRAGGRFDFLGQLNRPLEIGSEGYALFRQNGQVWAEDSVGPFDSKRLALRKRGWDHSFSRTAKRGLL